VWGPIRLPIMPVNHEKSPKAWRAVTQLSTPPLASGIAGVTGIVDANMPTSGDDRIGIPDLVVGDAQGGNVRCEGSGRLNT
jgi:hypothetical protein